MESAQAPFTTTFETGPEARTFDDLVDNRDLIPLQAFRRSQLFELGVTHGIFKEAVYDEKTGTVLKGTGDPGVPKSRLITILHGHNIVGVPRSGTQTPTTVSSKLDFPRVEITEKEIAQARADLESQLNAIQAKAGRAGLIAYASKVGMANATDAAAYPKPDDLKLGIMDFLFTVTAPEPDKGKGGKKS